MPRKKEWPPPIRQRGGNDVVRIRSAGGAVRQITLGPEGSEQSRQEYARILAEIEAHGAPIHAGESLTVAELAVRYLRHCRQEKEHRSAERAVRAFREVCRLYGRTRADEFGPLALVAVRDAWIREGLARTYINQLVVAARSGFSWAVSVEILPSHRADALRTVQGLRKGRRSRGAREPEKIRPADLGDVDATLPCLPPIVADMVRLQLVAGMRPGELCAVRPCDVVRDWMRVDGVSIWLIRYDEHKNDWRGHHRWVPLGPRAQALLAPYLEGRAPDAYCFSPREVAQQFAREHGREYRPGRKREPGLMYLTTAYDAVVRRACRRAFGTSVESRGWSPNQLRHTRATEIETSYGREDARCVLGHRTQSTTAIYAESVERAARVMAKVG